MVSVSTRTAKGFSTWLKLNKKVLSQTSRRRDPLQFKFQGEVLPEDVAEEINQDLYTQGFYLQVKNAILS